MDKVKFVPVSALLGDNAVKDKGKIGWWDGNTILQAINGFDAPEKPTGLPLRIPIQDVYNITGIGAVPVGRVETGTIKPGDNVVFMPSNNSGEVKSIEMHHEVVPEAVPGDNIGFNVRGIGKNDARRGDVCGPTDNPPTVVSSFIGQVAVLQHPSVIAAGYTPVFHSHTSQIACTFVELQKKLDPKTGQVKEENPDFLKTGDIAIVKILPTRPMVLEKAKEIPQLGRFAIRDMGTTVAAGMCIDVEVKVMK